MIAVSDFIQFQNVLIYRNSATDNLASNYLENVFAQRSINVTVLDPPVSVDSFDSLDNFLNENL